MALINSATSANRVVDAALSIVYTRRKIYGSWTWTNGLNETITYNSAWEYIRHATKTYKYVGMNETAANSAASALVTLYTRSTSVSEWNSSTGQFAAVSAGTVPMADVSAQHEAGGMWSVAVSVNETDSRISLSPSESFATLFYSENQRSYDTSSGGPTS